MTQIIRFIHSFFQNIDQSEAGECWTAAAACTFPLGLLKLPAGRLDVALHQSPDHLLSVGDLTVLRALLVGLHRGILHTTHIGL